MKTLFVVTTKDLPLSGFTEVQQDQISELSSFMSQNILNDYEDSSVKHYLLNFKHKTLNNDVREKFLINKEHIPILKRIVGDYGIYVSLCLSEDESGYGDNISHEYVGRLVDIACSDCQIDINHVFVIAHEADLTYAKEPPRIFGKDECLSDTLISIPDGHIYIFWHEARFEIYSNFIKLLSATDAQLLQGCEQVLKTFGA